MNPPSDLTFFECFAGVGGMSMGLETAGWRCIGHAEIKPFPRQVLAARWPGVRLHGDVTALQFEPDGAHGPPINAPLFDLLSGGSPCQDISVAGKRAGMVEGSATRSSLFFEQVRLWEESGAPNFLWENVPGAFSSNAGRDFAAVLSALVGAPVAVPHDGWRSAGVASGPRGVAAWRILDAQYFGVPQRRRRVFVLGARAGGIDPAEVLSLGESVRGDFASGRAAGEGVAADATAGARSGGGHDARRARGDGDDRGAVAFPWANAAGSVNMPVDEELSGPLRSAPNGEGAVLSFAPAHYTRGKAGAPSALASSLLADADKGDNEQIVVAFSTEQTPKAFTDGVAPMQRVPSKSGGGQPDCVVVFDEKNITSKANGSNPQLGDPACTLHDPRLLMVVPIDMRNATRTSEPDAQNRQGSGVGALGDASPTLTGLFTPAVAVFDARGNGDGLVVPPITGDHGNRVSDYTAIVMASGQANAEISADAVPALTGLHEAPIVFTQQRDAEYTELGVASTLSARDHKEATDIVIAPPITAGAHPGGANGMDAAEHAAAILAAQVAGTLDASLPAWGVQAAAAGHMPLSSGRPRRLMPVECARLQGWPDDHLMVPDAKGKAPSDSAMYKAAGNGIASPCVAWIAFRLAAAILHLRAVRSLPPDLKEGDEFYAR